MELTQKTIPADPTSTGMAQWRRDICFSIDTGTALSLQLLLPWAAEKPSPLIVFIQGSGYRFPQVGYQLPQMAAYARKGWAVAMATHRNSEDGHRAPAFLIDVKTAVRFLRKNAARFDIDPDRVAVWGTSSGGCAALLMGLTGDDPQFQSEEHTGYSDRVQAVIDCFGPADLLSMFQNRDLEKGPNWERLLGEDPDEQWRLLQLISPIQYLKEGQVLPSFLLMHGDADRKVPWEQSRMMAEKLAGCGADVTFITVAGAPHEGAFWSKAVHREAEAFLKRVL